MSKLHKYAITFATDDTWNSVDTLLLTTPKNPLDMTTEEIAEIFIGYGMDSERASMLAEDGDYWFIRNCEDTDVYYLNKGVSNESI